MSDATRAHINRPRPPPPPAPTVPRVATPTPPRPKVAAKPKAFGLKVYHDSSSESGDVADRYDLVPEDNPWLMLGFAHITHEAAIAQHPLHAKRTFRKLILKGHPDKQRDEVERQKGIVMTRRLYAAREICLVLETDEKTSMPLNTENQRARVAKAEQFFNGQAGVENLISGIAGNDYETRILPGAEFRHGISIQACGQRSRPFKVGLSQTQKGNIEADRQIAVMQTNTLIGVNNRRMYEIPAGVTCPIAKFEFQKGPMEAAFTSFTRLKFRSRLCRRTAQVNRGEAPELPRRELSCAARKLRRAAPQRGRECKRRVAD